MCEEEARRGFAALYTEHLFLGATFGESNLVDCYGSESLLQYQPSELTTLCDISHTRVLYFVGDDAPAFASAAFAGKVLDVLSCDFEAVVTGDGSIASIPLLARTDKNEYIALDPSGRSNMLEAWLSFLSHVSQDGYEPYGHMEALDATSRHVILMLRGHQATTVLRDYVRTQQIPHVGSLASCLLDNIPCVVLNVPFGSEPCYIIMVPPQRAVALWRSLLSFTQVTPVGLQSMRELATTYLPWQKDLASTKVIKMSASSLRHFGLIRSSGDYVGARALGKISA